MTRDDIVSRARGWLGTPYHHQASLCGVGTDCLGLVRGLYREIYAIEPEVPPPYDRTWAETTGVETLLLAARRHLAEIAISDALPGDVIVFRWRRQTVAKHVAVLATPSTFIHAIDGMPVAEVALSPWWRRRIAAAFAFRPPQ